jgi:hypothetical protein
LCHHSGVASSVFGRLFMPHYTVEATPPYWTVQCTVRGGKQAVW